MVVEFEINLEDLKALQKNALRTSKFHRRNKIINGFAGAVLALVISLSLRLDIIFSILIPILFFILGSTFYNIGLIYQTERIVKKNNALRVGDCKMSISEDGLKIEFKRTTQQFSWSEVKKVYDDENRYFIYISDIQSVIIKKEPKNMSESELINFNKLISGYIKKIEV